MRQRTHKNCLRSGTVKKGAVTRCTCEPRGSADNGLMGVARLSVQSGRSLFTVARRMFLKSDRAGISDKSFYLSSVKWLNRKKS